MIISLVSPFRKSEWRRLITWVIFSAQRLGFLGNIHRVPTPQLLDLCLSTGVSVVSVLKGYPLECECPRQHKTSKALPRKESAKVSLASREEALRRALSVSPPISVTAIAKELKLDRTSLTGKFPELSSLITKRYNEYRKESVQSRFKHELGVARGVIEKLQLAGIKLTHRNLRHHTNQPLMPTNPLWKAIKKVLAEECN